MLNERERLLTSVGLYKAKETQIDPYRTIRAITINGMGFEISLPQRLPDWTATEIDKTVLQKIEDEISRCAFWNFLNPAQSLGHRSTLAFIVQNWGLLLDSVGLLADSERAFCYPEVRLSPRSNHTPDCVGYGGNGNLFAVEVGTGKKAGTLRSELVALRSRCYGVPVSGILAYYKEERPNLFNVKLAFLGL